MPQVTKRHLICVQALMILEAAEVYQHGPPVRAIHQVPPFFVSALLLQRKKPSFRVVQVSQNQQKRSKKHEHRTPQRYHRHATDPRKLEG